MSFLGRASAGGLGKYWIVDFDPEYRWSIVSDSAGSSAFVLSRSRSVAPDVRVELIERAAAKSVDGSNLTEPLQRQS